MNWLTKTIRKVFPKKKISLDINENAWVKCRCGQMLYSNDLEQTMYVCPQCNEHLQIHPRTRFKHLFDGGIYEEIPYDSDFKDYLNFKGKRSYKERFYEARKKTNLEDCILIGSGKINGISIVCACQTFLFLGGSMGASAGEAIVKAAETSVENHVPLVLVTSSGGARMDENQLALQTLPKTTIAVSLVKEAGLPVIVVNTNPSTGGTMASFGSLGHITLAEPKSLVGFAGKRVIAATVNEELPEGFQTAESMGAFIDQIVERKDLKEKLSQILSILLKRAA